MEAAGHTSSELPGALELKGRPAPWGAARACALIACFAVGLWLRLHLLSAEGFADDELHKWLAANRYLAGDFSGDDVEHPMLMKSLIALTLLIGGRLGWAPETITRLPNALIGGFSIFLVAHLGRRLFGRTAGLLAAGLAAASSTFIGYQRVAKEDTLLGFFLMLLCLCLAEAKAAADSGSHAQARRYELAGAFALAGMLASKYFLFLTPIPVVFVLWVRGSETRFRIPLWRWLQLTGLAFVIWLFLNWTPLLPSTWAYLSSYIRGKQTIHGSLFFMGGLYHNLWGYGIHGTPAWFYAVFSAVKLAPVTVALALVGLALALFQRRPAHKLVLSWMGVWFLVHSLLGSKWGRFFVSVMPAFFLLAGYASAVLIERARARKPSALATAASVVICSLLLGSELWASIAHAPHYRTYISPLGGGDKKVTWYFPHCDYFDAGFREAVREVAARAEPGAELSTEIDWPARFYAERFGRTDLIHSLVRRDQACRVDRICYVIVQVGRYYFLNQEAVRNLAVREPWYVVRIRGVEVAKVYRLAPGESPFPHPTSDRWPAGDGHLGSTH